MTAKLAGLRYCPDGAIAAAAANSGLAEIASPSCAADSLVGSAAITSGSGPEPLHIETGKAFLAGPYHGAPLSLAVITPATAGPFDLGTVVVRVALFVDPKTAQVTTVTDPLPHIYGGALLDVRSVSVKIDRPEFSLNGTNCNPSSFAGTLRGGGANPADPAAFTSVAASSPYQATGCDSLPFGPKLFLRAFGATKRAKNPKLRAILVARRGDANISRAAVTLPKSMILDQGAHRQGLHPGPVRRRRTARSNSIYGFAEATTPLLDGPLKGPVYLRSSSNTAARPRRRPARPGRRRARRSHRLGQRPHPQHLRHRPRRPGLALRADDQGRQEEGPAGQLAEPLRPQAVRQART